MLGDGSAPVSPSPPQKPTPRTTPLASLRQPPAPMRPISAGRPGMHPWPAGTRPQRHLRSAPALPCVLRGRSSLPAPVRRPQTAKTVAAVCASLWQPRPAHWAVWPPPAASLAPRPCARPATATTIHTTHLGVRQHHQTTRGGKISARQAGAGQQKAGGKEVGRWEKRHKRAHLDVPGTHHTASVLPPVHPVTGPSRQLLRSSPSPRQLVPACPPASPPARRRCRPSSACKPPTKHHHHQPPPQTATSECAGLKGPQGPRNTDHSALDRPSRPAPPPSGPPKPAARTTSKKPSRADLPSATPATTLPSAVVVILLTICPDGLEGRTPAHPAGLWL
jgi:hypothetical protein